MRRLAGPGELLFSPTPLGESLWGDWWKRALCADLCYSKFYASFGGLLLYIEGPYKKLTSLKIENVYMLLKK
jgi:hypothetical protein